MDKEIFDLRYKLKAYRREELYPECLNIGLFGRTGVGKTSLINSLRCAVRGPCRMSHWLPVDTLKKAGGCTLTRIIAPLTGNIFVIDNRGFADLAKDGTLKELEAQMDGKRGYRDPVEWENPGGTAADDCMRDVYSRENCISCAVFVFSARDNFRESTNGLNDVVRFLRAQQGRYPLAVITNVDCSERERVYALRSTLEVTGISEIFEVANVIKDKTNLEVSYQHTLLSLLDRCMTDGDEAAAFKHNQQKEKMAKKDRMEKQAFIESNILCDCYFSDLAEQIGVEWQQLGYRLLLSKADIDHIIEDKQIAVDRICAVLQLWKNRSSCTNKRKMVEELCMALSNCNRKDLAEKVKEAAGHFPVDVKTHVDVGDTDDVAIKRQMMLTLERQRVLVMEQERVERKKMERERMEQERMEKRMVQERLEERMEQERMEREKLLRERQHVSLRVDMKNCTNQ